MTNNIIFKLNIGKNGELIIKVNDKTKKKINANNKTINTKEIYEMLNYKADNIYILEGERIPEEETRGKDNESKRLYNYVYDLLKEIVISINEINRK